MQSAETTSVAKARSVLRRFSHFMKLFDKLREELGARTMVGKEPPPKRTLVNVNKRPDLIEARRRELEQWLWRLVSDPLVARSVVLNKFLELSVAAKLVEQALAAQRALGIDTGLAAVSNEESGASDAAGPAAMGLASEFYSEDGASTHWGDAASTVTDAYYSPSTSAYWGNGQRGGFADQAGKRQGQQSTAGPSTLDQGNASQGEAGHVVGSARGPSQGPGSMREGSGSGSGMRRQAQDTAAALEARMRLGLRVEDRTNIKKQVVVLQQRLDTAAHDLTAAVTALRTERARSSELSGRVQELEEVALGSGASAREATLEAALAAERARSAELAHELEQAALQADLRLAAAIQQQRAADQTYGSEAVPRSDTAATGERLAAADAYEEVLQLQAQLESARREAAAAAEQQAAADSKWRADLKILAKEVKSLRRQLAAAQQQPPHLLAQDVHQDTLP